MRLKIYNTLNKKREVFIPINKGIVNIYACGITTSDNAHVGHLFQALCFDMIKKYLEYKGYSVNYIRNYTDIDDKIILKSNELKTDPLNLSQKLIRKTDKELKEFDINTTITCKVSENMPEIISFIEKLIKKDYAYIADNGSVYFSIEKFKEYGKLSNNKISENLNNVRKNLENGKKNINDFVLWKKSKENEPSWESPFGRGRAGWHIECSAMVLKYLPETIDIHGGGRDLIFPHHENEIAQTESLTEKKMANFWIHNGLIRIDGQKMSKSLGNSITIESLLENYDTDTIRFALLSNKYNSDVNITKGFFENAEKKIYEIYQTLQKVEDLKLIYQSDKDYNYEIVTTEFEKAMDNDFNSATAISLLLKYINKINTSIKDKTYNYAINLTDHIKKLYNILGLINKNPNEIIEKIRIKKIKQNNLNVEEINNKVKQIDDFKREKRYLESDDLRENLLNLGIIINNTKNGTIWDIKL